MGEEPAEAAALLAQALAGAGGSLLVVVDEAQHVEGPAAETLAALTRAAGPPWRLLVLGRRLPGALDGAPRLDADDLAFEPAEADTLLQAALGRATSPAESAAVYATARAGPR